MVIGQGEGELEPGSVGELALGELFQQGAIGRDGLLWLTGSLKRNGTSE